MAASFASKIAVNNQENDAEEIGYTRANIFDAEKHLEETSLRDRYGNPYPVCATQITKLGKYGVGLFLYLYFLKRATQIFFVLSLIASLAIYSNVSGEALSTEEQNSPWDQTVIANSKE